MAERDQKSAPRTRTFTWGDPMLAAAAAQTLSGLDFLQAMARGDHPAPAIGFDELPFEIERGKAAFFFEPREFHYNPIGSVHGGVLSTLLDSAMACAVQSMLPAGVIYTTLELKVNFVRAVRAGAGVMRCEGTLLSIGRRIATAEGRLLDPSGRLCAHATTTCMIVEAEKAKDPPRT